MLLFNALNQVLEHLGARMEAAELHGLLCGLTCTAQQPQATLWLEHVLPEDAEVRAGLAFPAHHKILLQLQTVIHDQLESSNLEFKPLLPADNEALALRSQAMGLWCQGFLFGLGLGGFKNPNGYSAQTREFISDVTEFTQVTAASTGSDEELEESAYMELFEYLRVGVLSVYEEKYDLRRPTLH